MKKLPIARTLRVFDKYYQPIPLEVYGDDAFKTLISTLLSSRTRDETTFTVCERLFKKASTIQKLGQLGELEIRNLIYPVGFYRQKAKNLSKTAQLLVENYDGRVPQTIEELTGLPGVGRKTANLILARAFGKPAISVDTHVHKIASLLGWVKTKTPEQTEKELMKIIPKKYWRDINRLFVSIVRQFRSKRKLMEFLESQNLLTK